MARSQCVCAVVHVALFTARGDRARRSPSAEVGRCWTHPILRVDTLPPRGSCTHRTHTCLTSTDLPRERSTEDPGAPMLCTVCVSPSSQPPPGSGAAKSNKNYRNVRPSGKLLAASVETTYRNSLHLADTPQLRKCHKNG